MLFQVRSRGQQHQQHHWGTLDAESWAAPRLAESESLKSENHCPTWYPSLGSESLQPHLSNLFHGEISQVNRQNVNQDGGPLKCHKDIIIAAFRPRSSEMPPLPRSITKFSSETTRKVSLA